MAEEKKAKQKYIGPEGVRTVDPASQEVEANRKDDFVDMSVPRVDFIDR